MKECIASFERMNFEEIHSLASDMAAYAPSILDREQNSRYLADQSLMDQHLSKLTKALYLGQSPPGIDQKIQLIHSVRKEDPRPVQLQHDIALFKTDFAEALQTLNR